MLSVLVSQVVYPSFECFEVFTESKMNKLANFVGFSIKLASKSIDSCSQVRHLCFRSDLALDKIYANSKEKIFTPKSVKIEVCLFETNTENIFLVATRVEQQIIQWIHPNGSVRSYIQSVQWSRWTKC